MSALNERDDLGFESGPTRCKDPAAPDRPPSPKGRPRAISRISDRDRVLLRWIAEQHTARVDIIAELLNPANALSLRRTQQIVRRWTSLGLVRAAELQASTPSFVWPTRQGMQAAHVSYRARRPTAAMLTHHHGVAVTRLALERNGPAHNWVSERRLAIERVHPQQHIPDGTYETVEGELVAVEVELTLKSALRLRGIIAALTFRYPRILYVTDDRAIARAVTGAAESVRVADRVTVASLSDLATR